MNLPASKFRRSNLIRQLVAESCADRRVRYRARFAKLGPGVVMPDVASRRRRANMLLDRMLSARLPDVVDCARYIEVLAGRQQMSSGVIATMMTSIERISMDPIRARALAVALADLMYFAEAGVSKGGEIGVYIAVAWDDDRLIVGLGIDGDISPVATAAATRAMLRARAIVLLLLGDFQRGIDGKRMVFGLTFPRDILAGDAE